MVEEVLFTDKKNTLDGYVIVFLNELVDDGEGLASECCDVLGIVEVRHEYLRVIDPVTELKFRHVHKVE